MVFTTSFGCLGEMSKRGIQFLTFNQSTLPYEEVENVEEGGKCHFCQEKFDHFCDNEQCRQCSSFSDYVKVTQKKAKEEKNSASNKDGEPRVRRTDCPLDKDELGNSSWGLLHTMAAKYPEKPSKCDQEDMKKFFKTLSKFYPCEFCAKDLRDELSVDPPQTQSQDALSQWLCRLHNKVNVKLGKEIFDCSKVNERWRDGWLDGSCDY